MKRRQAMQNLALVLGHIVRVGHGQVSDTAVRAGLG